MAGNDQSRRRYKDDPEKVIRIAQEGLEKHRAKGNVVTMDALAEPEHGVKLKRADRQRLHDIQCHAVVAMTERSWHSWIDTLVSLAQEMKALGFNSDHYNQECKRIEQAACEMADNPMLALEGHQWLRVEMVQRRISEALH